MLPDDLSKLTVAVLRDELKRRQQPTSGKKAELIARLQENIENAKQQEDVPEAPAAGPRAAPAPALARAEGAPEEAEGEGDRAVTETPPTAAAAVGTAEPTPEAPPVEPSAGAAVQAPSAAQDPDAPGPAEPAAHAVEGGAPAPAPPHAVPTAADVGGAAQAPSTLAGDGGQVRAETAAPAEPAEPAAPHAAGPEAAAGQGEEEAEIDYGDSEPEDHEPAAAGAMEAHPAEVLPPQEQRHQEGPRVAQNKVFGAALGALKHGGGGTAPDADGERKRGAGGSAPEGERAGKLQRRDAAPTPANAAAPTRAPPAQGPATRALHIDGFVRPFTLNQARDLLGCSGTVLSMWFPNIKNHCYVVFGAPEQAEAARQTLWELQWPAGSPKRLHPRFVSLKEAEAAIGTGAGNPDFRIARTPEDGPEEDEAQQDVAALEAAAAIGSAPPRGTAAAVPAAQDPVRGEEREQVQGGKASAIDGVTDLREVLSRRRTGEGRQRGEREDAPPAAAAPRLARAMPAAPPSLDDLFRKTAAKPCLYWLPLTEAQVAERRKKAAASAAAASAAAGNGMTI